MLICLLAAIFFALMELVLKSSDSESLPSMIKFHEYSQQRPKSDRHPFFFHQTSEFPTLTYYGYRDPKMKERR